MNDINTPYLNLLRDQVNDEIKYLQNVGHDTKNPVVPCIWCQQYKEKNICYRLNDLRQFQSQIMVQLNQKPIAEPKPAKFTTMALMPDLTLPILPVNDFDSMPLITISD